MCQQRNTEAILNLYGGALVLSVAVCCAIGCCLYQQAQQNKENAQQDAENKNALAEIQLFERKLTYETLMGSLRSYGTQYIYDYFIANNAAYYPTNSSLISFLSNEYNVTTGIRIIGKQCGPISLPPFVPQNTDNEIINRFYQRVNEDSSNLNPVFCFFAGLTDNEARYIPPSAYERLPKAALLGLGLNGNLSPDSQLYGFLQYKQVRLLRKDSAGNYLLCKQEFSENGSQTFSQNGYYPSSEQSIGDLRSLPKAASKVDFFADLSPYAKNYLWDCATTQEREILRNKINRKTRLARFFNDQFCITNPSARCLFCSPCAFAMDVGWFAIIIIIGAIALSFFNKLKKIPMIIVVLIALGISAVLAILQILYYCSDQNNQKIHPFMVENNLSYEGPSLNAQVIPL